MSTSSPGPKRPFATLDLKATEIKVSPINDKSAAPADVQVKPEEVPLPLAAKDYATPQASAGSTGKPLPPSAAEAAAAARAKPAASDKPAAASSASGASAGAAAAGRSTTGEDVVVTKRGGFFSHLAAGLVGGVLALGGSAYLLPELAQQGLLAQGTATSDVNDRLAKFEAALKNDVTSRTQAAETRLAALEKSTGVIGELKEAQSRLVAETKAALASAAGDAGTPDLAERLVTLENRLKAMSDAGANNPNAGRVEQIAALTGKVSDLETSMATQLTALRKNVSGDVEARVASAGEAAETARSGMQRIDRDVTALKTDAAKFDERMAQLKAEIDRTSEQNKLRQQELASLKVDLDTAKSSSAKPADVASALAPVTAKVSAIESGLKTVAQAEQVRRDNAERVVLALELQNLKRALDRGQKYDSELAEVARAAAGKFDLTALDKFKDQGVPTLPELSKDFRPSANAMIDAEAGVANVTVVDRLLAGAKSVVRVRKTHYDPADTSAEAVAGRMELALKDGRLGDVLNEANSLSPKAKDAVQPFLERVNARASVDKALASLEGQLKTSLSGAPSEPPSKTE